MFIKEVLINIKVTMDVGSNSNKKAGSSVIGE